MIHAWPASEMWYPVVILGAAFLLPVLAEDSPQGTPQDKIQETPQGSDHLRAKRLTTFGKSPTGETDPKSKLRLYLIARLYVGVA